LRCCAAAVCAGIGFIQQDHQKRSAKACATPGFIEGGSISAFSVLSGKIGPSFLAHGF
jgi:hypothetical protein